VKIGNIPSTPLLDWRADGDLTRLVAEIDGDEDYLVIDYDPGRPGDAKWYLTWFTPDNPSGLILQGDHDADGLKSYAQTWVGDE
jgi:hypothetical protein